MGDNNERILLERLRRAARNDSTLRSTMPERLWPFRVDARAHAQSPPDDLPSVLYPSPTGVDEFPFRNARGIYRYRSTVSRKGKSRRRKSRRRRSRKRKSRKKSSK